MKNFGLYCVPALLACGLSAPVWAQDKEEGTQASFSVQFSALKWSKSKTEYSDDTESSEVTNLMTGDLVDSLVWASAGSFNFYFYPFLDSNALLSVGYLLRDDLEVGFDLGLNSSKIKEPKSELASHLFGGFVTWIVPIGANSLENGAILDVTRTEVTEVNASSGEEETTKISGTFVKFSSTIVIPIAKNAWYMGGVWVAAENGKNNSTDVTRKSTQFGITLAGLRMTID